MSSPPDDRTSRARIRDEALRLFAEHGPDAVTIRDIAAAAGISPALVVRHYGSKDALRAAVDDHVAHIFEAMLAPVSTGPGALEPGALPSLAEMVTGHLPADSPIPGYLARLLVTSGPVGSALFRKLHAVSRDALDGLTESGSAESGADPDVRAAFLLVNDLAVLMLRSHLTELLGVDPLSAGGMQRWGAEVLSIYRSGLGGTAVST